MTVGTGTFRVQCVHSSALNSMSDHLDGYDIECFQVKNPWSHRRWKGKYSVEDAVNWTPALREALNVRGAISPPNSSCAASTIQGLTGDRLLNTMPM